ncbi:WhiB family transcriptional regulator [Streptomyces sp. NPDC057717]|uniref:WhiB family transcriptional regulator n=1 Tax=Streptomyces sp. NPDC057717 TaxID=3346224 RepID=UPI003698C514
MTATTLADLVAQFTRGTDWRHLAQCREYDPELFFPRGATDYAAVQAEDAKAVCRTCPVMQRCRQWALKEHIADGVWGGLTPKERDALKRRIAREKRAATA